MHLLRVHGTESPMKIVRKICGWSIIGGFAGGFIALIASVTGWGPAFAAVLGSVALVSLLTIGIALVIYD